MRREFKNAAKLLLASAVLVLGLTVPPDPAKAATIYDKNENAVDAVEPEILSTGSDSDLKKSTTVFSFELDGTESVPLNIKKDGKFVFSIASDREDGKINICKDEEGTDIVASSYVASQTESGYYESTIENVYLKAGTYYINTSVETAGKYQIGGWFYLSGDRTLTSGKWVITSPKSDKSKVYYKVKASKQSKITVEFDSGAAPTVTLCNSSKKAISTKEQITRSVGDRAYYAVKPGTYYLCVQSADSWYRLKATVKEAKDATGSSKDKAKTMKYNGSKIKGLLLTSDKTSKIDWVRISNPKAQATNVYFESDITSGSIKLEAISSSGKSMGSVTYSSIKPSGVANLYSIGTGYSGSTLAKGTYYVKIKKVSAKTSASYTVYLKNK